MFSLYPEVTVLSNKKQPFIKLLFVVAEMLRYLGQDSSSHTDDRNLCNDP